MDDDFRAEKWAAPKPLPPRKGETEGETTARHLAGSFNVEFPPVAAHDREIDDAIRRIEHALD